MSTKILGSAGERIAENYLEMKGYKILDKNFRWKKFGELDIITRKGDDIIFFEVKTRRKSNLSGFKPEDSITFQKQKKLIKLAQIWLAKNPAVAGQDNSWQIDVLAIEIYRDHTSDIRHLENAIGDLY